MNLREKERALLDTIALPTAEDWALLGGSASLVDDLNAALVSTLQEMKAGQHRSSDEVKEAIYGRLHALDIAHPEAGIADSEARLTVARFMGVNYHPRFYNFLRFCEW